MALVAGDQITWSFPAETAVFPHADVWVAGRASLALTRTQVTDGLKFPGDPSVSRTFTETGTWMYLCKIHAAFNGGVLDRQTGTAVVSAAPAGEAPSGVDFTEYRIKTGAARVTGSRPPNTGSANPFASQVLGLAEGQHAVEYRSTDKAGNFEATRSVSFGIDIPERGLRR